MQATDHLISVFGKRPGPLMGKDTLPHDVDRSRASKSPIMQCSCEKATGDFRANLRNAYMQQFNLNVQHEFPKDFLVQAGYVGGSGKRLWYGHQSNAAPYSAGVTHRMRSRADPSSRSITPESRASLRSVIPITTRCKSRQGNASPRATPCNWRIPTQSLSTRAPSRM